MPRLVEVLRDLKAGVQYFIGGGPDGTQGGLLRLHPFVLVMIAPQRAEVIGIKQHNAVFGCSSCYVLTDIDERRVGSARVFPFTTSDDDLKSARDAGCHQPHMRTAADTVYLAGRLPPGAGQDILGVTSRLSDLHRLVDFDYVLSATLFWLHQLDLGLGSQII